MSALFAPQDEIGPTLAGNYISFLSCKEGKSKVVTVSNFLFLHKCLRFWVLSSSLPFEK